MSAPSMRQRMKPLELVGLAAAFAVFTGVVVAITVRDVTLATIFGGVAFILALIVLAMLALVATPPADGDDDRPVLERERPVRPRRSDHH